MQPAPYRGPFTKDYSPLPKQKIPRGGWVLLRVINGFRPQTSSQWLLHEDGRLFHQPRGSAEATLDLARDLPATPTTTLDKQTLDAIRAKLTSPDFFAEPPLQGHITAEDGAQVVVAVRRGWFKHHQVLYHHFRPPLVKLLLGLGKPAQAEAGGDPVERGPRPADFSLVPPGELPEGALLLFRVFCPDARSNYRWLLYEDGRLFMNEHTWEGDPAKAFDVDWAAEPTRTADAAFVKQVRQQLAGADFFAQPPYQRYKAYDSGRTYAVTTRRDGATHEVVYRYFQSDLVKFLAAVDNP